MAALLSHSVREQVLALGRQHGVKLAFTLLDTQAEAITRLADEDPQQDDVRSTLLRLGQQGVLTPAQCQTFLLDWMRQDTYVKNTSDRPFDPFGNASTAGYLNNVHRLSGGRWLGQLEHQAFHLHFSRTLAWLAQRPTLDYAALLTTHRRLFEVLYPWAGQDRQTLTPQSSVRKGDTVFADPNEIGLAFEAGGRARTVGKTLGYWAYAHPFLDGNGRALFTFLTARLARQHQTLDWNKLDRTTFLSTLDLQIADPKGEALDHFLAPAVTAQRK
jgi:cell filamentation protein